MTQNNAASPTVTVLDMLGTLDGQADGFAVHNGVALDATLQGKRPSSDLERRGNDGVVALADRPNRVDDDAAPSSTPSLWTGAEPRRRLRPRRSRRARHSTSGSRTRSGPPPRRASPAPGRRQRRARRRRHDAAERCRARSASCPETRRPTCPGARRPMPPASPATSCTAGSSRRRAPATRPIPVAVHTSGATETTWTDTGLTNGTDLPLRRAGHGRGHQRRSPVQRPPTLRRVFATALTFGATPTTVAWGKPWTLSGELTSGGTAVPDAHGRGS